MTIPVAKLKSTEPKLSGIFIIFHVETNYY